MFLGALAAAFVVSGPTAAQPADAPTCATVTDHNRYARYVLRTSVGGHGGDFHGNKPTSRQLAKLGAMRACLKDTDRAKYRLARGAWEQRAERNRYYRHLDAITPYGEWAVPSYIVGRESGYSYRAYNPPPGGCSGNGCIGAYQIDSAWFSSSCSRWASIMWTPAGQHQCAYVILHTQGIHAWATA